MKTQKDKLFTENSNRPHGHGAINPNIFTPYPKNPAIAKVFKEIGWADELGSGVRNLFHYCKEYCGSNPKMMENDIFRFTLQLEKTPMKTSEKTPIQILKAIETNPDITITEIAKLIERSESAVYRAIKGLQNNEKLKRIGPDKGGYWKIV